MEIRDKTSFDCSGYNINPEQRKSSYIIESSNNFQTFLPENSQRAQAYLVTFSSGYFERDKTFTTFSKFTPSDIFDGEQVTFTLESLTSKDKKIFYDEVTRWRTQNTFLKPFEAKVDVLLGDGTILQRWHYTECGITDFKGFIVDDLLRMKHTYGMLPELRDETFTTFSKFTPSDIFDGEQVTFTLESLTSKDKKIFYDEVTRWRTQNTFLKPFEAKVDVLGGDGTILQRWHYTECGITDFKGFLVDDLLRMKHTYGMLPEIRDETYFNCKGFSLNVDQQKSSIANSFDTCESIMHLPEFCNKVPSPEITPT